MFTGIVSNYNNVSVCSVNHGKSPDKILVFKETQLYS